MYDENVRCRDLRDENNRLTEENAALKSENEALKYMLHDMQEAVNIANDEAVQEMFSVCGCIVIDGIHKSAAYQDMVGILLGNGYGVELEPVENGTKLMLTIKESED